MDKILQKVEHLNSDERKKLKDLLTEKSKSEQSLGWIYKEDKPESEEYLLGRRIDKHIDVPQPEEKNAPGALFQENIARRADLDMQAKIREDPLYAIRQKEEESRKRLLQNPIKMKQLQRLVEDKQKLEKKQKKKNKKEKKKREKEANSSDDDILKKYLAIVTQKSSEGNKDNSVSHRDSADSDDVPHSRHRREYERRESRDMMSRAQRSRDEHSRHQSDSNTSRKPTHRATDSNRQYTRREKEFRNVSRDRNSSEHDTSERTRSRHSKTNKKRNNRSSSSSSANEAIDSEALKNKKLYGLIVPSRHSDSKSSMKKNRSTSRSPRRKQQNRSASRSPRRKQQNRSTSRSPRRKPNRSTSRSPKRKHNARSRSRDRSSKNTSRSNRRSRSPEKNERTKGKESNQKDKEQHKKLSRDDMELKRQEMMQNAKQRDEQRELNVTRYRADDAKEDEKMKAIHKQGKSSDFINPLMNKHAGSSSLEDRLKRNRHNLQRSTAVQDNSFTQP